MGIKITNATFTVEDPKMVDFGNLPDDQFYIRKIFQSFSLIPKITHITKLIQLELEKIEKIAANAPKPIIKSEGMSASIQGPIRIDTTTLSSLEFSLLLLQFTYVEALCNVLSEVAIRQNQKNNVLSGIEIDHLKERKGNYKGGKADYSTSYVRIEDKIKDYLELFCKVNNDDFKFDKSSHYWSNFKSAKLIRDDITHPRNGVRSNVDRDVLFKMSCFIYWYTEMVHEKFDAYCDFKGYEMIESWTYGSLQLINSINKGGPEDIKNFTKKHNRFK